jgi:hypothetical protein
MSKTGDQFDALIKGLPSMLEDDSGSVHFSEFSEISHAMIKGYVGLVRQGKPEQTIALAMLGATLNLYGIFGLSASLPPLLRSLADKIEEKTRPN